MACERASLLRVACSEVWVISYRGYTSTRWDPSPSGSETRCSSTTPSKPASSHHYIPVQPPRGAFTLRCCTPKLTHLSESAWKKKEKKNAKLKSG